MLHKKGGEQLSSNIHILISSVNSWLHHFKEMYKAEKEGVHLPLGTMPNRHLTHCRS